MKSILFLFACTATLLADPAPNPGSGGAFYIIAGWHTEMPAQFQPIKEISIMRDYTLAIHLTNMQAGTILVPKITCTDPNGKLALTTEKRWSLRGGNVVLLYPISRAPEDEPGLYRWKAIVEGVGTLEQTLSLLPETPDGLKEAPVHEKAAENTFRAFSKYWLGLNDDFFLTIAGPGQTRRWMVTNYVNVTTGTKTQVKPADFTQKSPAYYGTSQPFYRVEVVEQKETITGIQRLLQVKNLGYDFSRNWLLTPAEELNGISYKGGGRFSFKLYRIYDAKDGWSDWSDVGAWDGWKPHEELSDLPLRFSVIQRDGNWFVTGSDGAKFANGKFIQEGKGERHDAPSVETVRGILEQGINFQREALRKAGGEARRDPAQIEQEAVNTILQLRRRTVAE